MAKRKKEEKKKETLGKRIDKVAKALEPFPFTDIALAIQAIGIGPLIHGPLSPVLAGTLAGGPIYRKKCQGVDEEEEIFHSKKDRTIFLSVTCTKGGFTVWKASSGDEIKEESEVGSVHGFEGTKTFEIEMKKCERIFIHGAIKDEISKGSYSIEFE